MNTSKLNIFKFHKIVDEYNLIGKKEDNKLKQAFNPYGSIDDPNKLYGREDSFIQLIEAITVDDRSSVVYGDRGVGKSSLALSLKNKINQSTDTTAYYKQISADSSLASIFEKPLKKIGIDVRTTSTSVSRSIDPSVAVKIPAVIEGKLGSSKINEVESIGEYYFLTIDHLIELLKDHDGVLIVDEFDQLDNVDHISQERKKTLSEIKLLLAQFIKNSSTVGSKFKLVIVGVAQNAKELVSYHKSNPRTLKRLRLNRLERPGLKKIISEGFKHLDIKVENKFVENIIQISNGFPYFCQLCCYMSAKYAISKNSKMIKFSSFNYIISQAIDEAETELYEIVEKIKTQFNSSQYPNTLVAASLTDHYDFTANEIKIIYDKLIDPQSRVKTLSYQVKNLVTERILIKKSTGVYSFMDPRLKSFIRLCRFDLVHNHIVLRKSIENKIADYSKIEPILRDQKIKMQTRFDVQIIFEDLNHLIDRYSRLDPEINTDVVIMKEIENSFFINKNKLQEWLESLKNDYQERDYKFINKLRSEFENISL